MKKFTLRLNKNIYKKIKNNSEFLGVGISCILKSNLYLLKDIEFDIVELDYTNSIRMTLSIPEEFYNNVKLKSEALNTSTNNFINSAFFHFLNN